MRHRTIASLLIALVLVAVAGCNRGSTRFARSPATSRSAGTMSEDEKIEAMIALVDGTKDVKFIRNGSEYDPGSAAQLMQYKWNRDRKQIKTARDFIRVAGTKSTTTGKLYQVRFKDGKEMTSEEFLTKKLAEIERTLP